MFARIFHPFVFHSPVVWTSHFARVAMDCLYHLVPLAAWEACKAASKPYYPPTYDADGFIHLTKAAELLLPVANHFYTDVPGMFCLYTALQCGVCTAT